MKKETINKIWAGIGSACIITLGAGAIKDMYKDYILKPDYDDWVCMADSIVKSLDAVMSEKSPRRAKLNPTFKNVGVKNIDMQMYNLFCKNKEGREVCTNVVIVSRKTKTIIVLCNVMSRTLDYFPEIENLDEWKVEWKKQM